MVEMREDVSSIANQVARVVHRKYHTYFDVADVRQELYIWCMRRDDKITEWLEHDMTSEEYKSGVRHLGKTLSRHADRYCRKMKAQKLGYELRDEHFYSPITISELLPHVWSDIVSTVNSDATKVSGGGNPAEGGNYVIQLFDVRSAMGKLDRYDRDILEFKFRDSMNFKELAEVLQVSDSTAHRKVDNALRRLTNFLGGSSPYGRKKESEAQ
jgi:hypothetical protein